MSDQRPDDETLGRALGRAVESQSVSETPFSRSRLSSRVDRPARGGWMGTLAVAAALGLFVAMGAFFASRGPQGGVATPDMSASPTVVATGPAPTTTATAVPTANASDAVLVYFARDRLPPVGATVPGPASFRALPAPDRISARVRALWDTRAPSSGGLGNVFKPHTGGAVLRNVTTTISGDTATVVIDAGTWDSLSSAETIAFAQQLVYTITEEMGIRRAAVREPGKDHAVIGTGIWRDPRSREDVFGYSVRGTGEIAVVGGELAAEVTDWRFSVDDVAPGLGRFVVELKAAGEVPQGFIPRLTARIETGRNTNAQEPGKYVLRLELPDTSWPQPLQCCLLRIVGVPETPIRQVAAYPLGTGSGRPGVGFAMDLDDARPWRVTVLYAPLRVVVDVGGHPEATVANTVVYSPQPGATASRDFRVTGLARAFEANVSWRLRDQAGGEVLKGFTTASQGSSAVWGTYEFRVQVPANVSGNVTLEVYQASPRDGTDTEKVSVRFQVR